MMPEKRENLRREGREKFGHATLAARLHFHTNYQERRIVRKKIRLRDRGREHIPDQGGKCPLALFPSLPESARLIKAVCQIFLPG